MSRRGWVSLDVQAEADRRDDARTPVLVSINESEGEVWDSDGRLTDADDRAGSRVVYLYADVTDGWRDGSVLGMDWTLMETEAYAQLSVANDENWRDHLRADLEREGYRVLGSLPPWPSRVAWRTIESDPLGLELARQARAAIVARGGTVGVAEVTVLRDWLNDRDRDIGRGELARLVLTLVPA